MTEPKTAQLTPEEWKQLGILNVAQLQNFLQSIPGAVETGASGLNAQALTLVDLHLNRLRTFLNAWARSKLDVPQVNVAQPDTASNGAAKKKGGWPKGKKRTRTPNPPAAQQ